MKNSRRNTIKKTLISIILPVSLFIGGCSTNIGPLKTSARISRGALDSLAGLNSNPAVMEFYKKYEERVEGQVERKNARLENTRKRLLVHTLSDPYLSYSIRKLMVEEQIEERKMMEDFCGNVTGDAFKDTIEEDLFRPLELETEFYNYFYKESSNKKTKEKSKIKKAKLYLSNLLDTEKIDFGIRPSFRSGRAGGRVFAKAEDFNLFTKFEEGKIEIGTDKKEKYKFRTRLSKKINKDWYVNLNLKLGKVIRNDLSVSFTRYYYDTRTRIKDDQKISDEHGKTRLAIFGGHNNINNSYIGLSIIKEY